MTKMLVDENEDNEYFIDYSYKPIDVVSDDGQWFGTYRYEPFLKRWFYIEPNMKGNMELVTTDDLPSEILKLASKIKYKKINSYYAPIKMQIQLNTSCNFNCKMCYVSPELKNKFLDLKQLDIILAKAKENGVLRINLVGGEIFMRNDIVEIVSLIKKHHLLVSCITNGMIPGINIPKYKKVLNEFYMVQVSCNGIEDSFNIEHNIKIWPKAKQCISNVIKNTQKNILSFVISEDNVDDIPNFLEFANKIKPTFVKFGTICWSGKSKDKKQTNYYKHIIPLARTYINEGRKKFPNLKIQSQIDIGEDTPLWEEYINGYRPLEFYFSPEGRDDLYLSASGKLFPFPLMSDNDKFCIGNYNDDWEYIWSNNKILSELRNVTFANSKCGKLGCTRVCGLWNRSYAISWTNDFYGKVPCEVDDTIENN